MVLHNRCHQLEAMLGEMAQRQDGNTEFFWHDFVGRVNGKFQPGRVGDCHDPPNATKDYDYFNKRFVDSDAEDWKPNGGPTKSINCDRWFSLPIAWPFPPSKNKDISEGDDNWYVYWNQNLPGRDNGIEYDKKALTNWWAFMGDWDGSVAKKLGLWRKTS